ncbi:hypothetical protein HF650_11185 [Kosakonia sp. SMBL-WEM22]|uniref:hypothetical protein n=1 Tax=Kosakonia sp. SMBL-WEM22 TaxID=2725560 RepID=UPI0016597039|nr:hypothetical protein [Kosakonia sp. SMBL-WEM22]QNQ20286.1 hypothetical protein HF650_11185 [Kosakonia sp. SMBL-WEM22]
MIQDGEKCNRKNHNHKTVFYPARTAIQLYLFRQLMALAPGYAGFANFLLTKCKLIVSRQIRRAPVLAHLL